VAAAKAYLTAALAAADQLAVGTGHGPVHHFHALWS
jgi:hydroxymethylpyrimidine/phosphomethylpyrimidine kinase